MSVPEPRQPEVEVPLADLRLALHLHTGPQYDRERGIWLCGACGAPAGAHFCRAVEEATARLRRLAR